MDKLAEATIISLDVCLTRSHLLSLEPELAKVECHLALLFKSVFGLRILRNKHADHADTTSRLDGLDQSVHHHVGDLLAIGIVTLVAAAPSVACLHNGCWPHVERISR